MHGSPEEAFTACKSSYFYFLIFWCFYTFPPNQTIVFFTPPRQRKKFWFKSVKFVLKRAVFVSQLMDVSDNRITNLMARVDCGIACFILVHLKNASGTCRIALDRLSLCTFCCCWGHFFFPWVLFHRQLVCYHIPFVSFLKKCFLGLAAGVIQSIGKTFVSVLVRTSIWVHDYDGCYFAPFIVVQVIQKKGCKFASNPLSPLCQKQHFESCEWRS